MDFTIALLAAAVSAGTPLLLATLGGILCERVGVMNLGVEGMMLIGAVAACITYVHTGSTLLALAVPVLCGGVLGLLHSFLTVTLAANQVVSGLALTLFGTGLSAYLGKSYAGTPIGGSLPVVHVPLIADIPVVGPLVSQWNVLIWCSFALVALLQLYLFHTSWGLNVRALGDQPQAADAMGIRVAGGRYLHTAFGSMLIGLAGAYLILAYSPSWIEGMTAGRGWIAVALVIFARWNPVRALFAAYFFGALDTLGFRIQLLGSLIPSYFLKMIPYLVTILVLMMIGWRNRNKPNGQPLALGQPYIREQRQ